MALSAKIGALAGKLAGLRGCHGDFGILAFANFRRDAQFGNLQAVGHISAMKDQCYRLPAFQRDLRRAIGETAGDYVDFPLPVGANRVSGAQKPCDCGEYVFHADISERPFLWSEILQTQLLVFRTEHRAHSHLPQNRARLARRNGLGSLVASPAVGAESSLTFRSVRWGPLGLRFRA